MNPILQRLPEHVNVIEFFEAMEFEVSFAYHGEQPDPDVFEGSYDEIRHRWTPDTPDGFTLAGKYETEAGLVALFVKPKSSFSDALLNFGLAQQRSSFEKGDPIYTPDGLGKFVRWKHHDTIEVDVDGMDGLYEVGMCEKPFTAPA